MSHRRSTRADTIRFQLALCRTAAVVALVLLAAPAFAVTTNVSVAGVPPDQVQGVTLVLSGGATVQAERADDDQTGTAVWVVDTPEAIPPGSTVDVYMEIVGGHTARYVTIVGADGTIAVDAEAFYTQSLSQAASVSNAASMSDATVAESLIVQTAPGNVIKFIPNFTPPLPGVDTWAYIRYQLREMGLLDLQPSTAGPASAENSQGASTVTDAWQAGSPWSFAGVQFRYVADLAPMDMSGGMTYQQQVADALQAIPSPSTSGSVTQDSTQWCHYGSGEGHPLGLGRWGDFGGLSLDSLRLEVNTEDGQDGDAWQFLNDWVRGPQRDQAGLGVHGYSSSGAPPPPVSPIRQRINDMHIEMAEEALQEEHDQDPVPRGRR